MNHMGGEFGGDKIGWGSELCVCVVIYINALSPGV